MAEIALAVLMDNVNELNIRRDKNRPQMTWSVFVDQFLMNDVSAAVMRYRNKAVDNYKHIAYNSVVHH